MIKPKGWFLAICLASSLGIPAVHAETPRFVVVLDGVTMFTEADVVRCKWRDLEFTLADTSMARICGFWNCSFAPPASGPVPASPNFPTHFSVVADGEVLFGGGVQLLWSSFMQEGPLISWPPLRGAHSSIRIGRGSMVELAQLEKIKETLLKAGVEVE